MKTYISQIDICKIYSIKSILSLFILMSFFNSYAQSDYPKIIDFSTLNGFKKDATPNTINYKFLLLTPKYTVDLRKHGNETCEFKILGSSGNKVILEFNQPSKTVSQGRCASGAEKGILLLTLNTETNRFDVYKYTLESCLFSIEIIKTKHLENQVTEYLCENLQSSESYTIQIDLLNLTISKKD